jgi:hypothetical protein
VQASVEIASAKIAIKVRSLECGVWSPVSDVRRLYLRGEKKLVLFSNWKNIIPLITINNFMKAMGEEFITACICKNAKFITQNQIEVGAGLVPARILQSKMNGHRRSPIRARTSPAPTFVPMPG